MGSEAITPTSARAQHPVGIGLRKELADALLQAPTGGKHDTLAGVATRNGPVLKPDFVEVSTENWAGQGGRSERLLREITERYPLTVHGLSLSLGSPDPLDRELLALTKSFLARHSVKLFSEHLAFCSCDNAHLYELLPIPFRGDAVKHVSSRIKMAQEILERRIAIENVSYYAALGSELTEQQFLCAIVDESDCDLLLDINNVFVNSRNHRYDPYSFLDSIPLDRVTAIHIAGHHENSDGSIVDTHGDAVRPEVFRLLSHVIPKIASDVPILLERDFNFDAVAPLQQELDAIRAASNRPPPDFSDHYAHG